MMQVLRVSDNRRYVVKANGEPFFWLGDTAWELFHRLNREEAELYLTTRAKQGFTVIQAVALAEFEGVTTDNAYGRRPLLLNADGLPDPAAPDTKGDYSYWAHVDYIVERASAHGLVVALLPTWGDKFHQAWGKGPEIFDAKNARAYGQWLGQRYRDQANIVWVLGGDRALAEQRHMEVVRAMAEGLAIGDGGRHLRTFHPVGEQSSSAFVHQEAWLDFHMIQSGHGAGVQNNYERVTADYALSPVRPTLDAEPCYEDHPVGFKAANGYFDAVDVRRAAYYALFAGAFGHTYGHHSVWSMTKVPGDYFITDWQSALQRPGASQMRHLRTLMESRSFLDRVPDQSMLVANREGANYMVCTRGDDYVMVYTPNGLAIDIALGRIRGSKVKASWFDPRTGAVMDAEPVAVVDAEPDAGTRDIANRGQATFQPPSSGRGEDWVLILDGCQ